VTGPPAAVHQISGRSPSYQKHGTEKMTGRRHDKFVRSPGTVQSNTGMGASRHRPFQPTDDAYRLYDRVLTGCLTADVMPTIGDRWDGLGSTASS
jgi:hypothetical protein